jgi:spermidine synthase
MGDGLAASLIGLSHFMSLYKWHLSVTILFFALILCIYVLPKQTAVFLCASTSVAVAGAAAMAFELIILNAYQAFFGSLYRELGLIVAAFMAGLVLSGSFFATRSLKTKHQQVYLIVALGAFSVLFFVTPSIIALSKHLPERLCQIIFFACVLMAGLALGVIFPLASRWLMTEGTQLSKAAGYLDAADHLGAAFGAFLGGVFFLPLFGQEATCYFFGLTLMLMAFGNAPLLRTKS